MTMRTAGLVLDVFGWLVCVGTSAAGGDKSYPMVNVAIPTLTPTTPPSTRHFVSLSVTSWAMLCSTRLDCWNSVCR